MPKPEIFIHVGMARTASTFFQSRVFPKLKGIYYQRNLNYHHATELLSRPDHNKYLISKELDNRDMRRRLGKFPELYSHAQPFIIIRRHDEWILSQYKRYLKNGLHLRFSEFLDLKNNQGFIKAEHLYYKEFIRSLDGCFEQKPVVYFYDDFRNDPEVFVNKLSQLMGIESDTSRMNLNPMHVSYGEKELRALYHITGVVKMKKNRIYSPKWTRALLHPWTEMLRYAVLYGARILPSGMVGNEHIFPSPEQLNMIREYFKDDWQWCVDYAGKN